MVFVKKHQLLGVPEPLLWEALIDMAQEQEQNWNKKPLRIALIVVGVILLIRFAGPLRFMLLTLIILGTIGFLGYLLYEFIRQQREKRKARGSLPAGVSERIELAREQIKRHREEAQKIRKNLRELRQQERQSDELNIKNRTDIQYLIREFEAELKLRDAKISFYRTAEHKLQRLLHNHQLSLTLAEKEEELRRLKEHHYDDLADMEEMRSDMELETLYLDTIDELSGKISDNLSLEHVEHLQDQLEEMTRGLERGKK